MPLTLRNEGVKHVSLMWRVNVCLSLCCGGGGGSGVGVSGGVRLVTCSKDSTVRVWDLDTQHCAQTIASLGAECWSLDVDPFGRAST